MKTNYYLIGAEYKPSACSVVKNTIALSENPVEFLVRNFKRMSENYRGEDWLTLAYVLPIAKAQYAKLKRFNPSNDGEYVRVLARDRGQRRQG